MNIEEIDKWLDNEYGVSYTRLEELHDFVVEQDLKHREEEDKEIERLNNKIEQLRTELNSKNNIINELENYTSENIEVLENRLNSPFCNFEKVTKELLIFQNYLDKLKELKENKQWIMNKQNY